MTRRNIRNEADLLRLPIWAQEQVTGLIREADNLREKRDELLADGPEDSDTFVAGWHTEPDRPLGTHVTINFGQKDVTYVNGKTGTEHVIDARWDAEKELLFISAYGGTLKVIPGGGVNSIRVGIETR
jgi:hypothetical protein